MKPTRGWRTFAGLTLAGFVSTPAVAETLFANGFEAPRIAINEVDTNPSPDFIEFHNPTAVPVDISGWKFTDSITFDPTHTYTFASGTVVGPGGFVFRVETTDFTFGLGSVDEVHLFDESGVEVDRFAWTIHAVGTYARCPDATGAFVDVASPTQGASNAPACPP